MSAPPGPSVRLAIATGIVVETAAPRPGESVRLHQGFDRNRDNRRFHQRPEPQAPEEQGASLPSFITAPVRGLNGDIEASDALSPVERVQGREHEGANFHLNSRRRRRPRTAIEGEAPGPEDDTPQSGELPLAD